MMRSKNFGVLAMVLVATLGAGLVGCEDPPPPQPPPTPTPVPPPPPAPAPRLPDYITVTQRIEFETDKDILLEQSKITLTNDVVSVLRNNPQIRLVEIGGHTDSTGDPDYNLLLSENRAKSVMAYLISQGIEPSRLRVRGYGDTVPVQKNNTEQGKQENRRVEFRIVEQG
jgi:OmpA-OmpF porin, OOP family